ncbi:hypothetical protein BJ875DRAFT_474334 [Amylocarpus encephaloides]|uniref:Uncharacterized protein n=1 Tax=Amylocarpus encephaloides TaxID=45428 RepID=A0A9P7Y9I3_9HELO|nr:hypothetical protein BJ875DRAFT_474334 [Amylocarpus encephaloides]
MVVAKLRIVQKHCVEKNGEASLTSCPIDFASSTTPPLSPIPTKDEAAPVRRVSERLSSNQKKRSYSTMQTAINGRRKFKRRKASVPQPTDSGTATSESIPNGRTIEGCITAYDIDELLSITDSAVSSSHESAAAEALADDTYRQSPEQMRSLADKERIDQDKENCTRMVDYDDGMNILEGYFSQPLELEPVDGAVSRHTLSSAKDDDIHQSYSANQFSDPQPSPTLQYISDGDSRATQLVETSRVDLTFKIRNADSNLQSTAIRTPCAKRGIMDESGYRLEDVTNTLSRTDDNSRISDSCPTGLRDQLHVEDTCAEYPKILSSISINCVKVNRQTAKPTLDIEQERLRNYERQELERIAEDRQQMNMALPARIASEINLQQYANRLKKTTENTIARLDIRDLAEKELLDAISEPTELTGEFREESDYTNVISHIEKGIANDTRTRQRSLWKETYFWPMIQQRAKMMGPLPDPPGRKTLITPQEKIAAKQLVLAIGHGTCRDTIFKWTSYWKLLSELRLAGAIALLIYRSSEFKTHFFRYTKELGVLLAWNNVFDFPLQQLRVRVLAEEGGDFSGKCDIEDKRIFERLRSTQLGAWANNLSIWDPDETEYNAFLADHSVIATSGKSNDYILRYGIKGKLASNKSVYVGIIPYEGDSGKKVIGTKPASTRLYSISPLVSVAPGDFLGVFSGKLRYTNQAPLRSVKGPVRGLWLDYLEMPGKLNQMRVARSGEKTNVCLAWEGVNETKGDKSFCQYWRILVLATREILPFDQLIRPP